MNSTYSVSTVERLQRAVELIDKDDEEECHWSPYCSREGEEYVTVHIGDKPYSVWTCGRCR